MLLLPETAIGGARVLAERIGQRTTERDLGAGDETIRVTANFGVTKYDSQSESADQLLVWSDNALLAAKREGRDRVVVADRDSALSTFTPDGTILDSIS